MKILRLFGYLWALPSTLWGLLLVVFYRPTRVRWSSGCIEMVAGEKDGQTRIWGRPGAQTHGWLIYYASEKRWNEMPIRVHERVHVVQCFIGGPFFIVAYAASFVWHWIFAPPVPSFEPRWKRGYRMIWFERRAYAIEERYVKGDLPDAWG